MSTDNKKRLAHRALVARILEGDGRTPRDQRRAAFDNSGLGQTLRPLIDKIAQRPAQVTEGDIAAVKTSGLAEDEIFELVVCAAVGQATRQYETALGALAQAANARGATEHASRDPR